MGTPRPAGRGLAPAALLAGWLLDRLVADPRRGHPVAGFGSLALAWERRYYRPTRPAGIASTLVLAGGAGALGVVADRLTRRSATTRFLLGTVATATVLGGTSLRREAAAMRRALDAGDLPAARDRLSSLCARDPAGLPASELARATVESVAENTSDAAVGALLWGAVAGVPGLLGYRAVNTLDAMVGYRSPRYADYGWAAARLDDAAGLAPARLTAALTVLAAPVVGGSPAAAWSAWRSGAPSHPSPNAGPCEAAAAGALGVRLGGTNAYRGDAGQGSETRGVLHPQGRPVAVGDIARAARLSAAVEVAALGVCLALRSRVRARGAGPPGAGARPLDRLSP